MASLVGMVNEENCGVFGGTQMSKPEAYYNTNGQGYLYPLVEAYEKAIDKMIAFLNDIDIDKKFRAKMILLMTSLVLDDKDVDTIKSSGKRFKEDYDAIPTISELSLINDIPFSFELIESLYIWIFNSCKKYGYIEQNGEFEKLKNWDIDVFKDGKYKAFYQNYIVTIDDKVINFDEVGTFEDLKAFNRANHALRERLYKIINKGKPVNTSDAIELRRRYRYNSSTDQFEERKNKNGKSAPVSKVVYQMLADKNRKAYEFLQSLAI